MSYIGLNPANNGGPGNQAAQELEKLQVQLNQLRARLSSQPEEVEISEVPQDVDLARLAKEILRSRRRRASVFDAELFGEPAWDILLELYVAESSQRRLQISSACAVSAVPATTALRWINKLESEGWVQRSSDPLDGRRHWVQLTERAFAALRAWLSSSTLRIA